MRSISYPAHALQWAKPSIILFIRRLPRCYVSCPSADLIVILGFPRVYVGCPMLYGGPDRQLYYFSGGCPDVTWVVPIDQMVQTINDIIYAGIAQSIRGLAHALQ